MKKTDSPIFSALRLLASAYLRLWRYTAFKLMLLGLLVFLGLDTAFPLPIREDYSAVICYADSSIAHIYLNKSDKWRVKIRQDEISEDIEKAFLAKEDQFFYFHFGINPFSVCRAALHNLLSGKRTSGASTITMQVARLISPASRTYSHKLLEGFRALQLEWHFSKKEILQMYLSRVPYSSNIEGIKAASLIYFKKSPNLMSLAEVSTLAIIPNRPNSLKLGSDNSLIIKERNEWLERFAEQGVFAQRDVADAKLENLTVRRNEMPKLLPHLSQRLKSERPNDCYIHTTIRPRLQHTVETHLSEHAKKTQVMGVENGAVMVIDNRTMEVVAYVGSADYQNTNDGGQVDGLRGIRSPGSALKPLVYGLAFDEGFLTPKSVLHDVYMSFNGWVPENYDMKHQGKVTVEKALTNSLNIPAVYVLNKLGKGKMIDALKNCHFESVKNQGQTLGLSLILGGCGVTPEEMCTLYASFANAGQWRKPRYTKDAMEDQQYQVISPESAFMLQDILGQMVRPDLPNGLDYSFRLPKIAWKTGTSYGKRDAWSIGYNRNYTVCVWMGNFSGAGVAELSGAQTATPLLMKIFNSIDYGNQSKPFPFPSKLALRTVCSETGDVPQDFCKNTVEDLVIQNVSSARRCEHLKEVMVSPSGSQSYCPHCASRHSCITRHYPNLLPELISFYKSHNINFEKVPPHNPACQGQSKGFAPQIQHPNQGSTYILNKDATPQLELLAFAGTEVYEIYWYVNNAFVGKSPPGKGLFVEPPNGPVLITCADEKGRRSSVDIFVE